MTRLLQDATVHELEQEIERRKKQQVPEPNWVDLPEPWARLRDHIINNVEVLAEDGYETKDVEHYTFEYAMEAVYGKDIWNWYNEQLK